MENENNHKNKDIKNDVDNISLKKIQEVAVLDKIKSSLNKLIIGQNENKNKSNGNK